MTKAQAMAFALVASLVVGCSGTPLMNYITANKFTPFVPARENNGEGTIIMFNHGQEAIVASADPPSGKCFREPVVHHGQGSVALPTTTYQIDASAQLEFELGKTLGSDVQVKGGFNDSRVKKVSIELIEPFMRTITVTDAVAYLKGLNVDDICRVAAFDKSHYVIHTVLGVKGIHYSFIDQSDNKLTLDATLLKQLHLSPGISTSFNGKDSIEINRTIFIGYRAWRGDTVAGTVELKEVRPPAPKRITKVTYLSEGLEISNSVLHRAYKEFRSIAGRTYTHGLVIAPPNFAGSLTYRIPAGAKRFKAWVTNYTDVCGGNPRGFRVTVQTTAIRPVVHDLSWNYADPIPVDIPVDNIPPEYEKELTITVDAMGDRTCAHSALGDPRFEPSITAPTQ